MQVEERIKLLLTATPQKLADIDAVLGGKEREPDRPPSLKLLRMGQAAKESGLSRCTLWRAIRDGRVRAVEVRKGSHRVPEAELLRLVEGRS